MATPKLTTSYAKFTDSALESKAESIVLAFTGNSFYLKPNPPLATVQEAITAFSDAIAAAVDGGRIKIAERRQARKVLEDLLRQLAAYATMIAMGDVTILTSSGIDLYKERGSQPDVTVPDSPELSSGNNSGEVLVKVARVETGRTYIFEWTMDPLSDASVWAQQFDSRTKFLCTGLQPGKKYWFRITVIGLRGAKAQSKPVPYMVQ